MGSYELFCELSETKVMRVPKQARIEEIARRVPMKGGLEVVVLAKDNVFYKIYLKDKEILWVFIYCIIVNDLFVNSWFVLFNNEYKLIINKIMLIIIRKQQ